MFQEETDLGAKFDTDHERHIYRIDVVVGVEFTANSAQYEHAKRNAELVLLHRIYGDILGDMAEITKAVYDNDGRRIINICSKIKDRFMERTT
jgi:hypothetical protein